MKFFTVRVGWRKRYYFAVSAWQAADMAKRSGITSRVWRTRVTETTPPFASTEAGEVTPPRPPLRREWVFSKLCTNVQKGVAKEKG